MNSLEALRKFRTHMESVKALVLEHYPDAGEEISFKDYFDGVDDCISILEELEDYERNS